MLKRLCAAGANLNVGEGPPCAPPCNNKVPAYSNFPGQTAAELRKQYRHGRSRPVSKKDGSSPCADNQTILLPNAQRPELFLTPLPGRGANNVPMFRM